eukprot:IDg16472t1
MDAVGNAAEAKAVLSKPAFPLETSPEQLSLRRAS